MVQENINTHKAIISISSYSIDILKFAELKIVESILKNTMLYGKGEVKRLKKGGIVYKDDYNEYIVEYNYSSNVLDFYTIKGKYLKYFDISAFLAKLDEYIELENL